MEIKHLKNSDYRRMPWKNGGGVTVEIAIHPKNASVDSFDWRISMASVPYNGWFSLFPQIERTLVLLEGKGVHLAINQEELSVTPQNPIVSFSGEADCYATLTDGGIEDLNIMTRKGKFRHDVIALELVDTAQSMQFAKLNLLVCLSPEGTVKIENQQYSMQLRDCLSISDNATISAAISGRGSFMMIKLTAAN